MIFYIDTSSCFLYSAVIYNNKLICEIKDKYERDLSTNTIYKIKQMFSENKITPKDIKNIMVVNGPGSFTGIRIGVTIAKTFAWAFSINIISISALEAMSLTTDQYKYTIPIIDARRNASYAGIYDNLGNCILKDQYIKNQELLNIVNNLSGSYTFVSNDTSIENDHIIEYQPNFLQIVTHYIQKEPTNPHLIIPNYLKLTEAEENLK